MNERTHDWGDSLQFISSRSFSFLSLPCPLTTPVITEVLRQTIHASAPRRPLYPCARLTIFPPFFYFIPSLSSFLFFHHSLTLFLPPFPYTLRSPFSFSPFLPTSISPSLSPPTSPRSPSSHTSSTLCSQHHSFALLSLFLTPFLLSRTFPPSRTFTRTVASTSLRP